MKRAATDPASGPAKQPKPAKAPAASGNGAKTPGDDAPNGTAGEFAFAPLLPVPHSAPTVTQMPSKFFKLPRPPKPPICKGLWASAPPLPLPAAVLGTANGPHAKYVYTGEVTCADGVMRPHGRGVAHVKEGPECTRGIIECAFKDALADGVGRLVIDKNYQYVGNFSAGRREGKFYGYNNNTGVLMAEWTYEDDVLEGPAWSTLDTGGKMEGNYQGGKRCGKWHITNPDGSRSTSVYDASGNEMLDKRTVSAAPTRADTDAPGADCETPPELSEALSTCRKQIEQHERKFVNDTVAEWRKEYPDATFDTEHPVGAKRIDVIVKNDGMVGIGEFKATPTALPHAAGQAMVYRSLLCAKDADVAAARRSGDLVTFVGVPSAPNAAEVSAVSEEASVETWWPGQPVPFARK